MRKYDPLHDNSMFMGEESDEHKSWRNRLYAFPWMLDFADYLVSSVRACLSYAFATAQVIGAIVCVSILFGVIVFTLGMDLLFKK